jgi:hypothetical protein
MTVLQRAVLSEPMDPSETQVEQSLSRLTSAVTQLRQRAASTDSETIKVLLIEAQEELSKLSSTFEESGRDSHTQSYTVQEPCDEAWRTEEDEDLALLQSIPLQGLLGACFEHETEKENRVSMERLSSVSTMSSLGGLSPKVSATPGTSMHSENKDLVARLEVKNSMQSPRPSLPCVDRRVWRAKTEQPAPDLWLFQSPTERSSAMLTGSDFISQRSPRPTLPCIHTDAVGEFSKCRDSIFSHSAALSCTASSASASSTQPLRRSTLSDASATVVRSDRELSTSSSMYEQRAKPTQPSIVNLKATMQPSVKLLANVISVHEHEHVDEDIDDAWELEFLKKCQQD